MPLIFFDAWTPIEVPEDLIINRPTAGTRRLPRIVDAPAAMRPSTTHGGERIQNNSNECQRAHESKGALAAAAAQARWSEKVPTAFAEAASHGVLMKICAMESLTSFAPIGASGLIDDVVADDRGNTAAVQRKAIAAGGDGLVEVPHPARPAPRVRRPGPRRRRGCPRDPDSSPLPAAGV